MGSTTSTWSLRSLEIFNFLKYFEIYFNPFIKGTVHIISSGIKGIVHVISSGIKVTVHVISRGIKGTVHVISRGIKWTVQVISSGIIGTVHVISSGIQYECPIHNITLYTKYRICVLYRVLF